MRLYGLSVLAISLIGVALRAIHLDIPMRYDESVTYLSYASRGWQYITTNYQNPNNHVFHSLLVSWLTTWLGDAPFVIRFPAFAAGCALVPATAWVGQRLHGPRAALLAAAVVATSPVLVEFSTNARGYTLLALCVVLAVGVGSVLAEGPRRIAWLAWIEVGVIGMYTIPTMAIPWLGLSVWLAVQLYEGGLEAGPRVRALGSLAGATVVIALVVIALYSGIVRRQGLDALVGNRFVAPAPVSSFVSGLPAAAWGILSHWARGVPPVLAAFGALSAAAASMLASRRWRQLIAALVLGSAAAVAVTRNVGEPRIWLWAVPVVAITGAIGVVEVARKVVRGATGAPTVVTATWLVVMSAYIALAKPVRQSVETGVVPEANTLFDSIAGDYRRGDAIIGDFVSVEPLRYYLQRWSETHEAPGRSAMQRSWVLLDTGDSARSAQVRSRVARLGMPPLEESTPLFELAGIRVYLFGRPAGSTDPRVAEAVDWHTGVAGQVDEERAHALLTEVAGETGSPVALAWMERCRAMGCMGFRDSQADVEGTAEVLAEARELALAGDAEASFLLGSSLQEGWGGTLDASGGAAWYERAADSGHVLAARLLGDAYASGRGVTRSDSAAAHWWTKAAEAGDATAQVEVGKAYEAGRGVARDPARARQWYEDSLERGYEEARQALEHLGSH